MRILVIGAGAIGGVLACVLSEKGHAVEARGRHGAIAKLRLEGGAYGPDREVKLATLDAAPDLVLVATKTQDLAAALAQHHATLLGDAPVVALQNGLAQDALVVDAVGPARAVAAIVALDAEYLGEGRIVCERKGTLVIGAPRREGEAAARRAMEALSEVVATRWTDNAQGARWTKLLVNLQNVVPALTGLSYQDAAKHPLLGRALIRMIQEARAVADAEGVTLAPLPWTSPLLLRGLTRLPEPLAHKLYVRRVTAVLGSKPAYGSTWQSMQRGQSLETEWLNGEVVRRGAAAAKRGADARGRALSARGVPTPVNARAIALAAKGETMDPDACGRALLAR